MAKNKNNNFNDIDNLLRDVDKDIKKSMMKIHVPSLVLSIIGLVFLFSPFTSLTSLTSLIALFSLVIGLVLSIVRRDTYKTKASFIICIIGLGLAIISFILNIIMFNLYS